MPINILVKITVTTITDSNGHLFVIAPKALVVRMVNIPISLIIMPPYDGQRYKFVVNISIGEMY